MLALLALTVALAPRFDFYANGPYDPSVPKPESILHFGPGERHSTFRDQERVVLAIAQSAKDRVRMFEYGQTAEGRPLKVFAISSPANIKRLTEIQREHAELASGKGDPAKTVPVVWINECIHGDETASFESAMWTMYNLAASRGELSKALDREVVILNPVYNPDGHERYVVYYNSVATGSADPESYEHRAPGVMLGRLNHYRFDMNRDRVAFSQDETREEFAEMLKWNPQVYIDQHGQVGSYFFPPEPMSVNANVDRARNAKWTEIFGRATGKAFDQHGFSYFTKNEFDLYYPGYIDSSNTLTGAIGMTHETDGGRVLSEEREDGSTVTLRQGMAKHFTSALAVVEAAAAHDKDLLADYARFKRQVCTGEAAGKFKRVIVEGDRRALRRLAEHLRYAGIKSQIATQPFFQPAAHDYWSGVAATDRSFRRGVLVVDLAQSQGALAKALLEPGQSFEDEFTKAQVAKRKSVPDGETYPGAGGAEFYDLTGWSLPLAQDLHAWWCESAPEFRGVPSVTEGTPAARAGAAPPSPLSKVGYAIPYTDDDDALAAFEALDQGVRGEVSTHEMSIAGYRFPAGTFLFLAGNNDDGYETKLAQIVSDHDADLLPLTSAYPEDDRYSPGSDYAISLRKPKVAVVMGTTGSLNECGAIWYLMERVWKLPFTPISADALNNGNLDKFTCIIVPAGTQVPTSGRFRDWISAGNVAISFEGALSGAADLTAVSGDPQSLPGSLFRAEMDPRSFLSYGYPAPADGGKIQLAVPIRGNRFYQIRKEGGSIITLPAGGKDPLLLSGWEWPDDTETHLKGTVFLQDVPIGRGHLVAYAQDPTDRAMWPGLYKTLLNAMLIGSGR